MENNSIKAGDYIIVQRQNYTKLHKLKPHGTISLGSNVLELDNVIGCKYSTTFQMMLKPGSKRLYTVEKVDEISTVSQLSKIESGKDNRNITAGNESQNLTRDDITKLRDSDCSSNDIIGQLITNSSTFTSKTEYSQVKYVKKKVKKYFEYIQVRKPTIRLLSQMFYRQDPTKTLGLRVDDLSQIIAYSNVQNEGNYLLYDSGTSGLVTAALLNAIGDCTEANLIHVHPGNECQKNALNAMQFSPERLRRCVHVNLYSVLRCFYQNKSSYVDEIAETPENFENVSRKRKHEGDDSIPPPPPKKPTWQHENERACRILESKVDSLVVISRDHPTNLVKALAPFLKGGRSLVVFSTQREPLQELFVYLKTRLDFVSIRLLGNFLREYQVLPDRTHPEVNMNFGGHVLTAFKLCE